MYPFPLIRDASNQLNVCLARASTGHYTNSRPGSEDGKGKGCRVGESTLDDARMMICYEHHTEHGHTLSKLEAVQQTWNSIT